MTDELLRQAERRPREYTLFDRDRGFSARVRETGAITLSYRPHPKFGKAAPIWLGQFPSISVAEARAKIDLMNRAMEQDGASLIGARDTFAQASEQFLRDGEWKWSEEYLKRTARAFRNRFIPHLGERRIGDLHPYNIRAAIVDTARSEAAIKNDLAKVSSMLSWCVRKGALSENILRGAYQPVASAHGHTHWNRLRDLSVDHLRDAFDVAARLEPQARLRFQIIVLTGLDDRELRWLGSQHIDANSGAVRISSGVTIRIGPRALKLLNEWIALRADAAGKIAIETRPIRALKVPQSLADALGGHRVTAAAIARSAVCRMSERRFNLIEWEEHLVDVAPALWPLPEDIEL
ncbi:MAG: integrase arm-type DNA-binding domain-containing protein [Pseudomonadota bacterium]